MAYGQIRVISSRNVRIMSYVKNAAAETEKQSSQLISSSMRTPSLTATAPNHKAVVVLRRRHVLPLSQEAHNFIELQAQMRLRLRNLPREDERRGWVMH